jgi:uncharacterized protein YkvS
MKLTIQLSLLGLCFSYMANFALAQDDEKLAHNLITLRGEVEDLQSELKILKSEHTNSMSYLNTRKTELQANADRKNLKIKQATVALEKLQSKVNLLGEGSEQMLPQVISLIASVKVRLKSGIPFKYTERLSVIEDIERKLIASQISSQSAINRLWAFIEDEIRLTRENAIYSQTIELNGEKLLVEVAKLGTVLMYFKTRDDLYGVVNKVNNNWTYELLSKTEQVQQVAELFNSLKKQISQGYITLPLTFNLTAQD